MIWDVLAAIAIGVGFLAVVFLALGLVMLWIEALDDGSPWATLPILALAVVFLCYAAFSIGWAVVR